MPGAFVRRSLAPRESLPAVGAGVAAGAAVGAVVFYFARIMLQKTPAGEAARVPAREVPKPGSARAQLMPRGASGRAEG